MNVQFFVSTRMAQAAARAIQLWRQPPPWIPRTRAATAAAAAAARWSSSPARIAQVWYKAAKPYDRQYQPDWHDLTLSATTALWATTTRTGEDAPPMRDVGAELVRCILSRKGRDCLFHQQDEAAALFLESREDPFGRFGLGGGCLDVVLDDGRSARYLFGRAEHLPEPAFCAPTAAVVAASASPGEFERALARSRQLPAVPARWMAAHTKTVPSWIFTGGAAGAVAFFVTR